MKKSQLISFLLTLFLGPIGLFYSSVAAALGFIIAAIAFGAVTYGVGALIIWPISILVGAAMVSKYNQKVDLEEKRHKELLAAQNPTE